MDYKTDAVIQSSLRREMKGEITIISVAHRLQTVLDADKIVSYLCLDVILAYNYELDGLGRRKDCKLSLVIEVQPPWGRVQEDKDAGAGNKPEGRGEKEAATIVFLD